MFLFLALAASGVAAESAPRAAEERGEENLLDEMQPTGAVELPETPGALPRIGGPIALVILFLLLVFVSKALVPFKTSSEDLTLYHYPTGVKRGLALALCLYGIAFLLGALEILYQVTLHGSSHEYFEQMTLAKMIAFTHAHLFGFTTSFIVIGVPFSMQFNHLAPYQWIFPIGLAACFVDILSWWGIKYVGQSFVPVSIGCGVLFSSSYLYMLIGLLRVLLFPQVVWRSDRDWRKGVARRDRPEP